MNSAIGFALNRGLFHLMLAIVSDVCGLVQHFSIYRFALALWRERETIGR